MARVPALALLALLAAAAHGGARAGAGVRACAGAGKSAAHVAAGAPPPPPPPQGGCPLRARPDALPPPLPPARLPPHSLPAGAAAARPPLPHLYSLGGPESAPGGGAADALAVGRAPRPPAGAVAPQAFVYNDYKAHIIMYLMPLPIFPVVGGKVKIDIVVRISADGAATPAGNAARRVGRWEGRAGAARGPGWGGPRVPARARAGGRPPRRAASPPAGARGRPSAALCALNPLRPAAQIENIGLVPYGKGGLIQLWSNVSQVPGAGLARPGFRRPRGRCASCREEERRRALSRPTGACARRR
jgi:hypothetical protein